MTRRLISTEPCHEMLPCDSHRQDDIARRGRVESNGHSRAGGNGGCGGHIRRDQRHRGGTAAVVQGLTLVHLSVRLELCLSHKSTLHTLNIP